jgi:hypothetical protein
VPNVHVDHTSEESRRAQALILDLVAAWSGGTETYLAELGRATEGVLADATQQELAQRVVALLDAAVLVNAATFGVLSVSQGDVPQGDEYEAASELQDHLRDIERFLDELRKRKRYG